MTIAIFDLVIASIVGLAVVLLGQAVVSYEVFTGKTLPRRGLWRHWRYAVIAAAGYSLLVGGSALLHLRPIYSLLLTTILIAVFYALFSWRSYAERERTIGNLRPFIASQRLVEQILIPSSPPEIDAAVPFHALCAELLDAQVAYLVALGPLASLVGPALSYPSHTSYQGASLVSIAAQFDPRQEMSPLDPEQYGGAVWAVPLWSERGLIGVFLLGSKHDGGLYTQEEIEVARVSGERLIDTQASAEIARRLMSLQRERLAQSQIIDRQTRRVLHDDVLPDLQTAMITLSSHSAGAGPVADAMTTLANAHRRISDLLREMPTTTAPEVARLGLIRALQQVVDDEFEGAFDDVTWQIGPEVPIKARAIPTLTAEVIFYAAREVIRNAARYGRGEDRKRPFCLTITASWQSGLEIEIEDNGVGLSMAGRPGGSGQGLALHSTMMAVIGGALTANSVPHQYTRVTLTLPQT